MLLLFPFFITYRLHVYIGFDIYSKCRFQIHHSSLYVIDFGCSQKNRVTTPPISQNTQKLIEVLEVWLLKEKDEEYSFGFIFGTFLCLIFTSKHHLSVTNNSNGLCEIFCVFFCISKTLNLSGFTCSIIKAFPRSCRTTGFSERSADWWCCWEKCRKKSLDVWKLLRNSNGFIHTFA